METSVRTPSLEAARESAAAGRPAGQGPLGAAAARLEKALEDAARLVRTIDALSARLDPPEPAAAPPPARADATGRMLHRIETLVDEFSNLADELRAATRPR